MESIKVKFGYGNLNIIRQLPFNAGSQGFSVAVMLAGRSPAREGREVGGGGGAGGGGGGGRGAPGRRRAGAARGAPPRGRAPPPPTSLPLPCAPFGARIPSSGVRGEDNGKALAGSRLLLSTQHHRKYTRE